MSRWWCSLKSLEKYGHLLDVDKILFVRGKVDCRRELPNIIAEELISIEEAGEKLAARVKITLHAAQVNEQKIANIRSICSSHKGKSPVYVTVVTDKGMRVSAVADKNAGRAAGCGILPKNGTAGRGWKISRCHGKMFIVHSQ